MSDKPDIPWNSPGFPSTLNNGDLLAYIRYISSDKDAADTLKARWESFWDNDYKTLGRLRHQIDTFEADRHAVERQKSELRSTIKQLEDEVRQYKEGRKIKALRATVKRLEKRVDVLSTERFRFKKSRPQAVKMEATEHDLRSEIKELKAKVAQMAWTIMELRQFNSVGPFRIVPPFTIFDHENLPATSTEVARMARIVHDSLI